MSNCFNWTAPSWFPRRSPSKSPPANAGNLRCRILAEGANGPTTLEADRILPTENGVFIIPDILANSGGVIVSYFEWVQDVQRFFWKAKDVQDRLQDIISSAFHRTLHFSVEKRTTMRMAALMSGNRQGGPGAPPTRTLPVSSQHHEGEGRILSMALA